MSIRLLTMTNNSIASLPIFQIASLLRKKKLRHRELVETCIKQIQKVEDKVGAFITLTLDKALKNADRLDRLATPEGPLLRGIPISVKDTFTTKDVRTTTGSKMLGDFIPPYDATSYKRLEDQGTILLGKTNMDEFAHGFTTEYSAFKTTKNPWDVTKIPGGSSGGSAASIAAGEALLSLGSENYGSIIQPSSYCGVVGMKPTYGRASRYGIIAMVSSLECPGIMARCVEDVAIGMSAISGIDPMDATTVNRARDDYYKNLSRQISGKKIAIIKPIMSEIDSTVTQHIESACAVFKKIGVTIGEVDWYDLSIDSTIYDILYRSEVASNLARYDGVRYGYHPEQMSSNLEQYYLSSRSLFGEHVKRQIITDPITLTERKDDVYRSALKMRRINRDYIDNIFKSYDAIITPASPFLSIAIGQVKDPIWREKNRKYGRLNAAILCPTALYGYPAISFPISGGKDGLPVGLNMFSARFCEQKLFDLAYAFQEESGLKCLKPIIN